MPDHYDESYIIEHFQEYCRCCLKNNKGKTGKTNKYKTFLKNSNLASEFSSIFGIDFMDTENLPANVCNDCYKMLPIFLEYHKTCLVTHKRLAEIKRRMAVEEELIEPIPVEVLESILADDILVPIFGGESLNGSEVIIDKPDAVAAPSKPESNSADDTRQLLHQKDKSGRLRRQCPQCGKFVRNLKEHKRIHQSDPYICHYCDKRITMKINMKQHLKTHFNIRDHQCPECPKSFGSTSALKNHSHIHSDARNFACNLCKKSFKSRDVLVQHQKIVHFKQAKIICELCETEKRFYSRNHYETHKRNVHATPVKCDICSYVLKNEQSLTRHKLTHGIGYENRQPEFKCPICGKICSRNNAYLQHLKCHNRPEGRGHKDSMKLGGRSQFDV